MRLLIVSQYFWPESFIINDLAIALKERGHHITVLTGIPNYPQGSFFDGYGLFKKTKETYKGVDIIRTPLFPRGKKNKLLLILNYLSFMFSASLLGPLYCRGKYDAIFVFQTSPVTIGIPGIIMRWLKKAPMLFWVQDLWPETLEAMGIIKHSFLKNTFRKFVNFIYRKSDAILTQSESFIKKISAQNIPLSKLIFFPNWANSFYRPVSKDKSKISVSELPKGFIIMFAGNIGEAQSFETLVKAAKRLESTPDLHWVILGDGHYLKKVKEMIAQRQLEERIHLLGRKEATAMPDYFAHADALLVSLKKDPLFELTIPSKVQPYLQSGKPILAALEGEGAYIINEAKAGIVCESENEQALADAALALYNASPARLQEWGENAHAYAKQHFNRNSSIEKLENQLFSLINDNAYSSAGSS